MTDIDFCNGTGCSIHQICERYLDYIARKKSGQSIEYARNGLGAERECSQFKQAEFYGN